jgi:hypothetical protein
MVVVRLLALPLAFALAAGLPGCTKDEVYRNIYEGARANNDSKKATPLENPRSDSISYEEYQKERRGDGDR